MICGHAFGGHGCGQCRSCRINLRRVWTTRLLLEMTQHVNASFVTLTYRPDCIPRGETLVKSHPVDWIRNLREARLRFKDLRSASVRYYLVGEYGDKTQRPHYHVALFGFAPCFRSRTRHLRGRFSCCPSCDELHRLWGYGEVDQGTLTAHSAGYICGYVVKKMTRRSDKRLNGRAPEFALMSRRPGIGLGVLPQLADAVRNNPHYLEEHWDVPSSINIGGKPMPLGQYFTRRLRKEVLHSEKTSQEAKALRFLRLAKEMARDSPGVTLKNGFVLPGVSDYFKSQKVRAAARLMREHVFQQERML